MAQYPSPWPSAERVRPSLSLKGRGEERSLLVFRCRIDAEDAEIVGEETEFLEGVDDAGIGGVTLDIGIELRRGEGAADHVAFELGHVDGIGGETAHGLVERGRHVADAEDEGGLDLAGI